jgi:predicted RNA-binding Zn-ribbon protein involved in translation (DUF1610 family)
MTPGNPQILTCPFCGKEKEIMSLVSGNTCNAELWSDNKQIAPMLPEISFVQKCPHCGKYYILSRQAVRYAPEGFSFEQGLLTYREMQEAFAQLQEEGYEEPYEEPNVRMMLHHAYNDYYHRSQEHPAPSPGDWEQFADNARWLIDNLITDTVLKAEFYREIGEFDTAVALLETRNPTSDTFVERIVEAVRDKAVNKDNKVFRLS